MYQSVSRFDHKMNAGFWAGLFAWMFGEHEKAEEGNEEDLEEAAEVLADK